MMMNIMTLKTATTTTTLGLFHHTRLQLEDLSRHFVFLFRIVFALAKEFIYSMISWGILTPNMSISMTGSTFSSHQNVWHVNCMSWLDMVSVSKIRYRSYVREAKAKTEPFVEYFLGLWCLLPWHSVVTCSETAF